MTLYAADRGVKGQMMEILVFVNRILNKHVLLLLMWPVENHVLLSASSVIFVVELTSIQII
jgi:hypothetical protein